LSDFKNRPFEKAKKATTENTEAYDEIKTEELDPLARKFQDEVKSNRGEKLNQSVEGILAGRMFYAQDAKEHGLIDEIGTLSRAVDLARELQQNALVDNFIKS